MTEIRLNAIKGLYDAELAAWLQADTNAEILAELNVAQGVRRI